MTKDEFKAGAHWAWRRSNTLGEPAQRVELLFLAKGRAGRCKVRHLDGELKGLEEFVHTGHLRCPWKEWPKIERDERRELALIRDVERADPLDPTVLDAATQVLYATGEDLWIEKHRGYTRCFEPTGWERVAARAGVDSASLQRIPAFKDRHGTLFVPNETLLDLAIAFARAEPEAVHVRLDTEEKKLVREGYALGETRAHEDLLRSKPAFWVARQWAGGATENKHVREELRRTQELL